MAKKKTVTAKRQPKAKTAYELLARVCEAIKAHPLAYYQAAWTLQGKDSVQASMDLTDRQMADSCGTAYCRAGWIVALHDGPRAVRDMDVMAKHWGDGLPIASRADQILGTTSDMTSPLYDGDACGSVARPGTRAYVAAGVRGIRQFMKRHEAHLKARTLKGV